MTKVVHGVGGLEHTEWRSFHNDRYTRQALPDPKSPRLDG